MRPNNLKLHEFDGTLQTNY